VTESPSGVVGYAGLITRSVAFIIDILVINLAVALVGAIVNLLASLVGHSGGLSTEAAVVGGVIWWLWVVSYFVVFWTLTGQTPGSRLLGIRVQSTSGGSLHVRQALRRFGGVVLAALPLGAGFLLILVDERRRGLQDRIGATVVRWVPDEFGDVPTPDLPVVAPASLELEAGGPTGASAAHPAP
jgi:uncharacterized RDD family membrane protein YckC